MKHARKAHLVQLAFESDLTKKLKTDRKENVFRQFSTSNRRLQLFQLNSVDLLYFELFGVFFYSIGSALVCFILKNSIF